ncbi:hypothetical protein AAG570_014093 [Ranatra chinensis]|uniref:Uncharacterized protein n=1 Tax=Ranatra chinensis TaxID=642074 RepID=A0ABD0YAR3_9HEMI
MRVNTAGRQLGTFMTTRQALHEMQHLNGTLQHAQRRGTEDQTFSLRKEGLASTPRAIASTSFMGGEEVREVGSTEERLGCCYGEEECCLDERGAEVYAPQPPECPSMPSCRPKELTEFRHFSLVLCTLRPTRPSRTHPSYPPRRLKRWTPYLVSGAVRHTTGFGQSAILSGKLPSFGKVKVMDSLIGNMTRSMEEDAENGGISMFGQTTQFAIVGSFHKGLPPLGPYKGSRFCAERLAHTVLTVAHGAWCVVRGYVEDEVGTSRGGSSAGPLRSVAQIQLKSAASKGSRRLAGAGWWGCHLRTFLPPPTRVEVAGSFWVGREVAAVPSAASAASAASGHSAATPSTSSGRVRLLLFATCYVDSRLPMTVVMEPYGLPDYYTMSYARASAVRHLQRRLTSVHGPSPPEERPTYRTAVISNLCGRSALVGDSGLTTLAENMFCVGARHVAYMASDRITVSAATTFSTPLHRVDEGVTSGERHGANDSLICEEGSRGGTHPSLEPSTQTGVPSAPWPSVTPHCLIMFIRCDCRVVRARDGSHDGVRECGQWAASSHPGGTELMKNDVLRGNGIIIIATDTLCCQMLSHDTNRMVILRGDTELSGDCDTALKIRGTITYLKNAIVRLQIDTELSGDRAARYVVWPDVIT